MIKSKLYTTVHRLMLAATATGLLTTAHAQISVDALAPSAQDQIASLLAEKATRTPAQLKMDSQLIYASRMAQGQAITSKVQTLEVLLDQDKNHRVLVDIAATVDKRMLKLIAKLGGSVVNSHPEANAVRAYLPLDKIETFAAQDAVLFVRPADLADTARYDLSKPERKAARQRLKELQRVQPPSETQVGAATTEGDADHRGPAARSALAALGTGTAGLRIGVLSDSIDDATGSYAKAIASGDVPPVTVITGQAGSGAGEGLAMLEIVADICPGSKLYFATANGGQAQFAANIRSLRAAGCDIIIDDEQYYVESPYYDDLVAQAVNDVTASGAFYFSSAGNSGNRSKNSAGNWEGTFVNGGTYSGVVPSGDTKGYVVHNFSATATPQLYDSFPATAPTGGGTRFGILQWNDSPAGPSTNDYDLFYTNAAGTTIINAGTTVQNGGAGQPAYEFFQCSGTSFVNNRFVIVKATAAANRYVRLNTGRGYLTVTTGGQTYGHNSAANTICCAATPASAASSGGNPTTTGPAGPFPNPFSAANGVEGFTSEGPRRLFFNPDGSFLGTANDFTAAGGIVRQTPTLTTADGVTTTLPSGSGLNPFYGTSASAPHAGAIAGLLLAKNPNLTQAQMRAALVSACIDIEASGYDNVSGFGILDALNGVNAVNSGPGKLSSGVDFRVLTPDGTGVVSRGTTSKVYVALANTGGNTSLTGATATLTTSTPNVTVRAKPSTYGDINPGTTLDNATPFLLTTTSGFPIAGTIALNYTLTYNGVSTSYPFTIPTAFTVSSTSNRFETTAPAQVVPDNTPAGINVPFTVSGLTAPVGKVVISAYCNNSTFIGDLVFTLIAPNGTTVNLATNVGTTETSFGAGPADAQRITFDDAATAALSEATVTTGGTYKPSQALATFAGLSQTVANGTWTLNIADVGPGDVSTFQVSSLFIQQAQ